VQVSLELPFSNAHTLLDAVACPRHRSPGSQHTSTVRLSVHRSRLRRARAYVSLQPLIEGCWFASRLRGKFLFRLKELMVQVFIGNAGDSLFYTFHKHRIFSEKLVERGILETFQSQDAPHERYNFQCVIMVKSAGL
jgi:hypothetical protein